VHVVVELCVFELRVDGVGFEEVEGGSVGSKQPPNQPGYSQLEAFDEEVVECAEVVVMEGAGAGEGVAALVVDSSPSKHPNHPGVLQVEVDDLLVVVVVVVSVLEVDSSRQPHHPGVLQVSVLVLLVFDFVFEVDVDVDVDVDVGTVKDVVVSVPLLSKYCQG
jgi:hypothetical protein